MNYEGPKSYREAGVDIDASDEAINSLLDILKYKREGLGAPIEMKGGFAGLVDFGEYGLSLCTDGVGTKMLVAEAMDKFDTVGIDCMAMNVNDMICIGATPLAFVDYLAVSKPDSEVIKEIAVGLNRGAELADVTIIGGETAELPEMINGYDLAGTALGFVKKKDLVDGTDISPGDLVVGIPSSGIHSNGLTLARKIVEGAKLPLHQKEVRLNKSVGEELLTPTVIYVKPILEILQFHEVKGMANITGGGLKNLLRMKKGVGFDIDEPLPILPIFQFLQELSEIDDKEMYTTFNMGMGFAIVASEEAVDGIIKTLKANNLDAEVVGRVVDKKGVAIGTEVLE